jgi:hypothetical protein
MNQLRGYLANAYGGLADHRCTNLSVDRPIKIDDRNEHDVYPLFCSMMVHVPDSAEDTVILSIQDIPLTADIRAVIEAQGGSVRQILSGYTAEISMKVKSLPFLRKLAKSLRSAVGRGKRYEDPNWKWICGRTADSLEKFAQVLKAYNSEPS